MFVIRWRLATAKLLPKNFIVHLFESKSKLVCDKSKPKVYPTENYPSRSWSRHDAVRWEKLQNSLDFLDFFFCSVL